MSWAGRKTPLSSFKPIKLSDPFPPFDAGKNGYGALQLLVRLHGMPLGYVTMPWVPRACSRENLKRAILAEHSGNILRHLLCDWLAEPLRPDRFSVGELFKRPDPVFHFTAGDSWQLKTFLRLLPDNRRESI